MKNTPDLSLVIACYNEAEHIEKSLPDLIDVLDKTHLRYELIVIDDCSQDSTPVLLEKLLKDRQDSQLHIHAQNKGRGGTVSEGFRLAKGDWVGYLDIDLEIGPWYLFPALEKLTDEQYDGVTAHRIYKLDAHPTVFIRQMLSIGFRKLSHMFLSLPITDAAGGFKFFNRQKIMAAVEQCESTHWFWDTELVYHAHDNGMKITEIPVLFLRRPEKISTVKLIPDTIRQISETYRLWQRTRSKKRPDA